MHEVIFPTIVENVDGHDQSMILPSYELKTKRIVTLNGEVNDNTAYNVITQLRYLDEKSDDDIIFYINSPGGSVTAGMAILDTMNSLRCDVCTVALGHAASMGAFLLCAGTKGKRYAAPNADIMIHQPLGGAQGQATDISIVAEHIQFIKKKLAGIMANACGQDESTLMRDTERDNWKTAEEAKDYGLVDHVGLPNHKEE